MKDFKSKIINRLYDEAFLESNSDSVEDTYNFIELSELASGDYFNFINRHSTEEKIVPFNISQVSAIRTSFVKNALNHESSDLFEELFSELSKFLKPRELSKVKKAIKQSNSRIHKNHFNTLIIDQSES